jgi:signal transduction histidine kinase
MQDNHNASDSAALEDVKPGDHLCLIGEDDAATLAIAARFLRLGLERGEKCLYVLDVEARPDALDALARAGIDVAAALTDKQLALVASKTAHERGAASDAYRMFTFWKRTARTSWREGYAAMRVVGDLNWYSCNRAGGRDRIAYEYRLTQLAQDFNCIFLCQYCRRRVPEGIMASLIRVHPIVIHRGTVCRNIYHAPWEESGPSTAPARDVDRLLDTLRQHQQSFESLQRERQELERDEQRRQELHLGAAVAASPAPFAVVEPIFDECGIIGFTWVYMNSAAADALGRTLAEVVGRRIADVTPWLSDVAELFDCCIRVAQTGRHEYIELGDARGGVQRWWEGVVARSDKRLAIWAREVTDRKLVEHDLQRSAAYLEEGQRIGRTGSWAWDVARREISFWSLEHYRIMGLDPADGLPQYSLFASMVHPDDLAYIEEKFYRAVEHPIEFDFGYRIFRPDRTLRHVHTFGRPVYDGNGKLIEYLGTIIDLTEPKRSEEALRKTQAELARVSRVLALESLTASIAHEVAQPLASIITDTGAALRWLTGIWPDLDEVRAALERAAASGRRANDVIARIRSLVKKIDNGKELLEANTMIAEVVSLMSDELRCSHIVLRTQFDASLPPVPADRVQIQQVLINLIGNAIDAINERAEGLREILVETSLSGTERIRIEVHDTGVGLDLVDAQWIFDCLHTTKSHGLGMGLPISREIVHAHGGELWAVRNELGPGATFCFTLPLRDDAA